MNLLLDSKSRAIYNPDVNHPPGQSKIQITRCRDEELYNLGPDIDATFVPGFNYCFNASLSAVE
jgi:hypothetical protein